MISTWERQKDSKVEGSSPLKPPSTEVEEEEEEDKEEEEKEEEEIASLTRNS